MALCLKLVEKLLQNNLAFGNLEYTDIFRPGRVSTTG